MIVQLSVISVFVYAISTRIGPGAWLWHLLVHDEVWLFGACLVYVLCGYLCVCVCVCVCVCSCGSFPLCLLAFPFAQIESFIHVCMCVYVLCLFDVPSKTP